MDTVDSFIICSKQSIAARNKSSRLFLVSLESRESMEYVGTTVGTRRLLYGMARSHSIQHPLYY